MAQIPEPVIQNRDKFNVKFNFNENQLSKLTFRTLRYLRTSEAS